jgi:hypothetical protein
MAGNVLRFFIPRLWLKRDLVIRARRYMRAVVYTFNLHTCVLALLASLAVVSSTCGYSSSSNMVQLARYNQQPLLCLQYFCDKMGFSWNMDVTLVAFGKLHK